MRRSGIALILGAGLVASAASAGAKDKGKRTLPPYVLAAHTVAVLVDPGAGVSVEDPRANQVAQKDVETALLNWGRYEPVMGAETADLIVVVRKGHGRLVEDTISDPRQNGRAGAINPTDNGGGIGAQHGAQPGLSGAGGPSPGQRSPRTQADIGESDDTLTVYQGGVENPLEGAPAWRYTAKDGLRAHSVPAVGEFRRAVADAEKAAAKKP